MIFDICVLDSAYEFILELFKITGSEFINGYMIQCTGNIDEFLNKHLDYIDSVDIDSLKYMVLHSMSN